MKQHLSLFAAVLILVSNFGYSAFANEGPKSTPVQSQAKDRARDADHDSDADDPDLPPGLQKVDKAEYLKMREQYINRLRGVPYHLPYNPRVRAIRQMETAEQQLKQQRWQKTAQRGGVRPADSAWTPIGPDPVPKGQTVGKGNSVSGRVTSIAVKPDDPNMVYVGTAQGGVYRSLDGGATWTSLFDQALTLTVGALALDPVNPSILFVGTGEANGSADSFFGVGIYIIRNADTTADLTGPFNLDSGGNDVFTGNSISQILVNPSDDNTVFISSGPGYGGIGGAFDFSSPNTGLFKTTNALSASPVFTKLDVPPGIDSRTVNDMVFESGNPNNLICSVYGSSSSGDGGLWRTTNAMDASPVFSQVLAFKESGIRCALTATKNGSSIVVYAATSEKGKVGSCSDPSYGGELRKSTDGGVTWTSLVSGAEGFCGGQCYYDIAIAVDPTSAGRVYLGGSAETSCSSPMKRSSDSSGSMQSTDNGLHADTHVIAVSPSNPSIIYTGNDGGIFKSTDSGDTWKSINNAGFSATQFESVAVHPVDPNFTIGGTQDNGTLLFGADRTWKQIDYGDGGYTLIDQNATDTRSGLLYHTYYNSRSQVGFARVAKTAAANPNSWTVLGCFSGGGVVGNGLPCTDTSVLFYAPMAFGPGKPSPVYFGTDRLYRSPKKGNKMKVVSPPPIVPFVAISSIGISPQDDNVRIVGLEDGQVFAVMDGSANMTEVTSPDFPFDFVARAVIDPHNSNTAYITFSGYGDTPGQHVWKTTNLGGADTWVPAGSGIPDVPVSAFVIDPANSNNLYAGTDIGVYRSTDGGATWTPFSEGLPRVAVFDMAIQASGRILRIATHGRGLWERSIP